MNNKLINKALLFTAGNFNNSGHNFGKPVYFHCLNVMYKAIEMKYSEEIILGALMHDLLEDTLCTKQEISETFSKSLSDLVQALSFKDSISDKLEKNIDTINRSAEFGKEALIIKCLDVADNSDYYHLSSDVNKMYLSKKCDYLLKTCDKYIPKEPAYIYLRQRLEMNDINLD